MFRVVEYRIIDDNNDYPVRTMDLFVLFCVSWRGVRGLGLHLLSVMSLPSPETPRHLKLGMTREGTSVFFAISLNNSDCIKTFRINLSSFFYAEKFYLNYLMSASLT